MKTNFFDLAYVNFSFNFELVELETLEKLCYRICPARVKAKQNLNKSKRKTALAAFILAAFCIKKHFKISNFSFFKINGKPFIKNEKNAFFNISHSNGLIACATCSCPVGVDVEKIRPVSLALAEKILCAAELSRFRNLKNAEQQNLFLFKAWSAKESFAKMKAESILFNLKPVNSIYIPNSKTLDLKFNSSSFVLSCCSCFRRRFAFSKIDFKAVVQAFLI